MKWVGGQEGADSWTVSCRRGGGEPEVEIKGNLWVDLLVERQSDHNGNKSKNCHLGSSKVAKVPGPRSFSSTWTLYVLKQ